MNKSPVSFLLVFLLVLSLAGCQTTSSPIVQISPTSAAAAPTIQPPPPTETLSTTQILPSPTPTTPPYTPSPTPSSRILTLENATQIAAIHRLGRGTIIAAPAYNLSARLLAVQTKIGIDLYDMDSLELLRTLPAYPWFPLSDGSLSFSPDGKYLAYPYQGIDFSPEGLAAPPDHATILLWNTQDGSLQAQFPGPSGVYISDLAVSPAGDTLAVGFTDSTGKVFSLPDARLLFTFHGQRLVYSPDGSTLVSMPYGIADSSDQIDLYDLSSGERLHHWDGQRASFTPQGQLAVENAGAVRLIDLSDYRVLQAFNGSQAVFSSDGQRVALYSQEKVDLYDLQDGTRLLTFEGVDEQVVGLYFAPDGQTLTGKMLKCSTPNCVYPEPYTAVWRVADGVLLKAQAGMESPSWVIYAPAGHNLLRTTQEELTLSDSLTGDGSARISGYSLFAEGLAFTPDGQTLASASGEPLLQAQLWNLTTFSPLQRLVDQGDNGSWEFPVAFNQDGRLLALGGELWSVPDGKRLSQMEQELAAAAHSGPFRSNAIAFSPDGKLLAMESHQDQNGDYLDTGFSDIALFNLEDNSLVLRPSGPSGTVNSLAFSPDGEMLAAALGYPVFTIQIWRVADGQPLLTIPGKEWTHEFMQVVFSPDEKQLATVAYNQDNLDLSVAQIWDAQNGAELHQLNATGVRRVAYSTAGDVLASGSNDRLVRLWDSHSGALLQSLIGHADGITDLAFAPDGSLLASASADGTVILWGLP